MKGLPKRPERVKSLSGEEYEINLSDDSAATLYRDGIALLSVPISAATADSDIQKFVQRVNKVLSGKQAPNASDISVAKKRVARLRFAGDVVEESP